MQIHIDLNHIYLLGWHSSNGRLNLTSWAGSQKFIDVVVVRATDDDMARIMWNAAPHKDFDLLLIPAGVNRLGYAKENNGLHAFGWYVEGGIIRPPMIESRNYWDWLEKMRGTYER